MAVGDVHRGHGTRSGSHSLSRSQLEEFDCKKLKSICSRVTWRQKRERREKKVRSGKFQTVQAELKFECDDDDDDE